MSIISDGVCRFLVGTDIVARGIDVDGISHVINYDMPNNPDSYVHRIGRTARAGASGIALSFCDAGEVEMLKDIERLTRHTLAAFEDHPFHSSDIAALHERKAITPGVRFSPGHRFEDMPAGSFGRRPVHRRPR